MRHDDLMQVLNRGSRGYVWFLPTMRVVFAHMHLNAFSCIYIHFTNKHVHSYKCIL